ncbi:MAG: metallopeptidase TldD-related protein, partial [Terriglobales bacterium]
MSEPLSLKFGREVLATAAGAAGVTAAQAQVEVTLEEQRSELTRFANNAIHQHAGDRELALSVRTQIGGRTARASTHRLDQKGIEAAAERALALTKVQADDAERLPMATAAEAAARPGVGTVQRYDATTAAITPAQRADAVAAMVGAARRGKLTAAGICSTSETRLALLNANGLEAFHAATSAEYSVTMLGETSSGWAKGSSWRWDDLKPEAAAELARQKAEASSNPIEIAAQPYTVILEPAAVLDLLGFAMWDFGGQAVLYQRSFLCERLGTKLFGDNVSISDNAGHALQTGAPFDGEGMPRQRLQLVERGTVRDL